MGGGPIFGGPDRPNYHPGADAAAKQAAAQQAKQAEEQRRRAEEQKRKNAEIQRKNAERQKILDEKQAIQDKKDRLREQGQLAYAAGRQGTIAQPEEQTVRRKSLLGGAL